MPSPDGGASVDYDVLWRRLDDFVRYNPGARHRRRAVRRLLARCRLRSLLDVGCGSGELLVDLLRTFGPLERVWGVDQSAESVRRNAERMPGVTFRQLDLERERLGETFDVVTCCEVIEHVAAQADAVANLAAMVAPGGHLVLTCPTGRIFETERGWGHLRHPSRADLLGWTRAAGLEPVALENWGWPVYRLTKWATNLDPGWSRRHFAAGAYGPLQRAVSGALDLANRLNARDSTHGCQLFGLFRRPSAPGAA